MMKRSGSKRLWITVCMICVILCTSCGHRDPIPTGAVLSQMLLCEEGCPTGQIYQDTAEEGEAGYFSESLCAALYGDGAIPKEWNAVEEFAIFLTAVDHPAELAVFCAYSRAGAEEIAELCMRRLTVLRKYWRGSEYEAYTAGGRVVIVGRYVLMCISRDADMAIEEARRMIG